MNAGPATTVVRGRHFRAERFDYASFFFSGLTGLATLLILAILAVILINILINGWSALSWRFVSTIPKEDFFNPDTTGVLPMVIGTTIRVFLMTIAVLPVGVTTAVYLTEYAPSASPVTRIIRGAVNNLAGVPSIVFGLFGVGFFINFIGANLDRLAGNEASGQETRIGTRPPPPWSGCPACSSSWRSATSSAGGSAG